MGGRGLKRAAFAAGSAALSLLILNACTTTRTTGDASGRVTPTATGGVPAPTVSPTATPAPPPPQARAIPKATGPACTTHGLEVARWPSLDGETGEHNVLLAFTNKTTRTCWVRGTPPITAYDDDAKRIPIKSGPRSHYVTNRPAETLSLPSGASVYLLVAKFRCDEPPSTEIRALELVMPQGGTLNVILPSGGGIGFLDYCLAPGDVAGRYLAVSPLSSTAERTTGWSNQYG